MHKIGLKLWSINTDYYYGEAVKLYKKGIYDYIELYIVPGSINTLPKWKDLEIPFIIHAPHFAHGFNLAMVEYAERNFEKYLEVKEFADVLMAKYIIFHGGTDGCVNEAARQLASYNEPRALIENKPYKAIPNKMGGRFCRGATIDELEVIIKVANCGFCFDVGHAVCAAASLNVKPYSYLDEIISLSPVMFHLTNIASLDDEYDMHLHLNSGSLDIKKVLSIFPENPIITIESNKDNKKNLDDFVGDAEIISELLLPGK